MGGRGSKLCAADLCCTKGENKDKYVHHDLVPETSSGGKLAITDKQGETFLSDIERITPETNKTKNRNRHRQPDTDSDEDEDQDNRGSNGPQTQVIEYVPIMQIGPNNRIVNPKTKIVTNNYTVPKLKKEKTAKPNEEKSEDVSKHGGGDPFRNADGDDLPGLVFDMVTEAKKSVGIIRGPGNLQGTGFLLKGNKVMTAYHVIEDIVSEEGSTKILRRKTTQDKKISIQFDYQELRNAGDTETRFYFESDIPYENTALDVIVLQLSSENIQNLPQPLENFSKVQHKMKAHMIGHPGGGILKIDTNIERFILPDELCKQAIEWSQTNYGENGYKGIQDSRKILFHCRFAHGASGCPGCYADITKNKVEVVWMLIEGYPGFYYKRLTQAQRNSIPDSFLIEQGITMEAIWNDMSQKKPDLYKTIFVHQN